MNERRIARIEQQIKERLAIAVQRELSDPRLGFVTITRVEVDREMHRCIVHWSVLGGVREQRLSAAALDHAKGLLRTDVAKVLHTRTVPRLEFRFDESVVGAQRMQELLDNLRQERGDEDVADGKDPPPPE